MSVIPKNKKTLVSRAKRTETVSIRLDPETRYIAELAARKTRRPLSSFIECVVAKSFESIEMQPRGVSTEPRSLKDEIHFLWDSQKAVRLVLLGALYPDLLTFDEQRIWRVFEVAQPILFGAVNRFKEENRSPDENPYSNFYKMEIAPLAAMVWKDVVRVLEEGLDEGSSEYADIVSKVRETFTPICVWLFGHRPIWMENNENF